MKDWQTLERGEQPGCQQDLASDFMSDSSLCALCQYLSHSVAGLFFFLRKVTIGMIFQIGPH